MLPRVLEPEVMDSIEEAQDYDSMDHTQVNRVFVADFLNCWDGQGPVLDVGTGTAQIPIELCRHSPQAQVVAIDLAEHMLVVGRENVRKASFMDRIRLERQDAKHLPYPALSFAAIISNSIVHHIPEPAAVLTEIVRVARPGAILFIRDLLRPPSDEAVRHLVATYAGNSNTHQQKMFDDSLRAALSLDEIRSLVIGLGFDANTVKQTTDRHWTWRATAV
ncbi:MAG TPA: class I SAM-dependent methyltransferase [Gemmataceae bacterium]|nr:class I SAM-dependent methyltransferase [Gemmataceae bacterium]